MSTIPLKKYSFAVEGGRRRERPNRKVEFKVPLRLLRLCVLGAILPAILVAGPVYLRYRVYSAQLYPLTISDQRLIDGKISTTWCQRQVVKVNTTFNAYLMSHEPNIKGELIPVSMTRHLVLEDDMKEYWGFYLLRGSSVTVSTCVRWPGASLTIIRGHKHLHECAFIGDDSSEELEELLQVVEEKGLLEINETLPDARSPSNAPDKMTKAHQDVQFHHKPNNKNRTYFSSSFQNPTSHELDANAMRNILTLLMKKTLEMKEKQKDNFHHRYEGVYRESANIDKPPIMEKEFDPRDLFDFSQSDSKEAKFEIKKEEIKITRSEEHDAEILVQKLINKKENVDLNFSETKESVNQLKLETSTIKLIYKGLKREEVNLNETQIEENGYQAELERSTVKYKENFTTKNIQLTTEKITEQKKIEKMKEFESLKEIAEIEKKIDEINDKDPTSAEVFGEVMRKIVSQGAKGKKLFQQLVDEIDDQKLKKILIMKMENITKVEEDKLRRRRDLILTSSLQDELSKDDEERDSAIEEGLLTPDGIADDRGTVNETTLNDKSNSEFWSSFSSSEERLLECKGLILNLPLTPHRQCTPKHEDQHSLASIANTVTYRVPANGYYFFVFNSENEIQPNYLRIRFDLLKTTYNTSNPVHACENSTNECSLPFNFFSDQKTVLELPARGNESQWNEEFIVISTCEPRTSIYIFCVITVPLLILIFAFH